MQLRDTTAHSVPAARTMDLITTETKDEVLVYDQTAHHIHHLNAVTAQVWRLCDGVHTVSDIAVETGIGAESVRLALRQLEDVKLLEGELAAEMRGTQTRRAFMKKATIAGAIAVPAIVSISSPTAAEQSSAARCKGNNKPSGCACSSNSDCRSNNCNTGFCA